jgi:hypothetical protein
MVPDDYKDFFLGTVTVAGALIGLLFVAVSVHPSGVGADARPALRIRSTSALTALLNAMFISLFALLPNESLAAAAVALGAVGTLTLVSLLIFVLARGRDEGRWTLARNITLIIGQSVAYIWQIFTGRHLMQHPHQVADVSTLTTLTVVFLAFGVARAWEYVGGAQTGLWGAVAEARRVTHPPTSESATTHKPAT